MAEPVVQPGDRNARFARVALPWLPMIARVAQALTHDTANVLHIPIGTVRSRLYRARRQLQQALVHCAIDAGFDAAPEHPSDPRTAHAIS